MLDRSVQRPHIGQRTLLRMIPVLLTALVIGGCRTESKPSAEQVVAWRLIGTWSGRGNGQADTFIGDTGALRIRWKTTNELPLGTGLFRLTVHSSVSGRPLELAVNHRGIGDGTAYVNEDPREFFTVVESANLDWSYTVEEAFMGTPRGRSGK
jgi:hypothetical protein